MSYLLNPQLAYIPISACEYLVRASHLESYSILLTDDGDELVKTIFSEFQHAAFSTQDLSVLCQVEESYITEQLKDLLDLGVLLEVEINGSEPAVQSAWTAFARYGTSPSSAHLRPIEVYGDSLASRIVEELRVLGIDSTYRKIADLTDLSDYAWDDRQLPVDYKFKQIGTDCRPLSEIPVLVVALTSQIVGRMHEINTLAVGAGAPILYVQSSGAYAAIGPHVHPGSSPCYWEFELQRSRSMSDFSDYRTFLTSGIEGDPSPFGVAFTALNSVPWVIELAATSQSSLSGKVFLGRLTTNELQRQSILRLPRCPTCMPTRPLMRNHVIT